MCCSFSIQWREPVDVECIPLLRVTQTYFRKTKLEVPEKIEDEVARPEGLRAGVGVLGRPLSR